MKKSLKINTNIFFYIAVFLVPFENLFFAPTAGWATIAPILFGIYFILNINKIIKLVKIKNIWIAILIAFALNIYNFILTDFSVYRTGNTLITLGLGVMEYYTFVYYYERNKLLDKVIKILLVAYAISIAIGIVQWIAIKFNISFIINLFHILLKRSNYLNVGRVQFSFTEPSFISMHLYGVLLPLYYATKNKKVLITIVMFVLLSFLFNSGVRVILDTLIVIIIMIIYHAIANKRNRKYLLIVILLIPLFIFMLFSNNNRFENIVTNGVYADASLASRFFRIESSIYGYAKKPINFITGYGLGNSTIPIAEGFDKAYLNYKNEYTYEIIGYQTYNEHSNDNASFCLYIRIISEFGILIFAFLIYQVYKIYKNSTFAYKLPLLLIVGYLYLQFDSYAFYSIWLVFAILNITKKLEVKEK
ncbi:MAG: O-antigen ligase family protein [Bacilli bacterium]|nr:O-antigen ligase family protein [Bacilli bacterium]